MKMLPVEEATGGSGGRLISFYFLEAVTYVRFSVHHYFHHPATMLLLLPPMLLSL